jgi:hypothetical protein
MFEKDRQEISFRFCGLKKVGTNKNVEEDKEIG